MRREMVLSQYQIRNKKMYVMEQIKQIEDKSLYSKFESGVSNLMTNYGTDVLEGLESDREFKDQIEWWVKSGLTLQNLQKEKVFPKVFGKDIHFLRKITFKKIEDIVYRRWLETPNGMKMKELMEQKLQKGV
jgi:hypothetical protein